MLTRRSENILRIFLLIVKMLEIKRKSRQRRRFWVRKLYLDRQNHGLFESALRNLARDEEQCKKSLRMPLSLFNVLHELLENSLKTFNQDSNIFPMQIIYNTIVSKLQFYSVFVISRSLVTW